MKNKINLNFPSTWNLENYQQFLKKLKTIQDEQYQAFQAKLIPDKISIIGIRMPLLHKLALQISNSNYNDFIQYNTHKYYEETLLHGLLLGYIKIDFENRLAMLEQFLPYNTNWAINDTVCANLKQFQKNQEIGYKWIQKRLNSKNPWNIRFGMILLLNHYMNDSYIDSILQLVTKPYIDHYYVNMAIAWLISICYIKYPEKTILVLENKKLDIWIHNKTISKIRDSKQISKEQKDYLNTLKR